MYVVGATVLSRFWTKHPQCEAELRALHALLSETNVRDLNTLLGKAGAFDEASATLDLPCTRVGLDINAAAGVVMVKSVATREVD